MPSIISSPRGQLRTTETFSGSSSSRRFHSVAVTIGQNELGCAAGKGRLAHRPRRAGHPGSRLLIFMASRSTLNMAGHPDDPLDVTRNVEPHGTTSKELRPADRSSHRRIVNCRAWVSGNHQIRHALISWSRIGMAPTPNFNPRIAEAVRGWGRLSSNPKKPTMVQGQTGADPAVEFDHKRDKRGKRTPLSSCRFGASRNR